MKDSPWRERVPPLRVPSYAKVSEGRRPWRYNWGMNEAKLQGPPVLEWVTEEAVKAGMGDMRAGWAQYLEGQGLLEEHDLKLEKQLGAYARMQLIALSGVVLGNRLGGSNLRDQALAGLVDLVGYNLARFMQDDQVRGYGCLGTEDVWKAQVEEGFEPGKDLLTAVMVSRKTKGVPRWLEQVLIDNQRLEELGEGELGWSQTYKAAVMVAQRFSGVDADFEVRFSRASVDSKWSRPEIYRYGDEARRLVVGGMKLMMTTDLPWSPSLRDAAKARSLAESGTL